MVSYERSLFAWFVLAVVGWPAVGLALVLVAAGIVRTRLAWELVVPFAVLAGWTGWAVWQSNREWRRMDGIDATPGQNLLDRSAPYPQPLRSPDRP